MEIKLVLEERDGETYLVLPNEILSSVGIYVGTVVDVSVIDGKLAIQSVESMKNTTDAK